MNKEVINIGIVSKGRLKEDSIIMHTNQGLCIPDRKLLEQRAFI